MGSFLSDIGLIEKEELVPAHKWKKFDESDDEFKTLLTACVVLEKLVINESTNAKAILLVNELL